jgi:hypothetical protein
MIRYGNARRQPHNQQHNQDSQRQARQIATAGIVVGWGFITRVHGRTLRAFSR